MSRSSRAFIRILIAAFASSCLASGCSQRGSALEHPKSGTGESPDTGETVNSAKPTKPFPLDGHLHPLSIDRSKITISGVSSGGFMAVQMHVAHSSVISGAASVAGGIYWCAEGEERKSFGQCMALPSRINVATYTAKAESAAAAGEIDLVKNLARARIFLFASPMDSVISSAETEKLRDFYAHFVPESQILTDYSVPSAHGFPTESYGNDCDQMGTPWLLKCNYDTAGKILTQLYGPLKPKTSYDKSRLFPFEQNEFAPKDAKMFKDGSIYVPKACEQGSRTKCRLHVALHGCQMSPDFIQQEFREHGGYNEWAEANNIVVLYPQSSKFDGNPYGCWDWFGYTGPDYVTKKGPQIKAIKAMIDKVSL